MGKGGYRDLVSVTARLRGHREKVGRQKPAAAPGRQQRGPPQVTQHSRTAPLARPTQQATARALPRSRPHQGRVGLRIVKAWGSDPGREAHIRNHRAACHANAVPGSSGPLPFYIKPYLIAHPLYK